MALTNFHKSNRLTKYLYSAFVIIRKKSMQVEMDALDEFTSNLMQKKSDKWENLKVKNQLAPTTQKEVVQIKILGDKLKLHNMTTEELNIIFQHHLDENSQHEILSLIVECRKFRRIPSNFILTNVLSHFAQTANAEGIKKTRELCSLMNPDFLEMNSDFKHYLAETIWIKGNALKAIEIFEDVYNENPYLRRRIRLMLKYLISDAISNHSEAVLVNLVKFTENLVKKYKDYFLMVCLWQRCFLSEWFSDQQVALELIERNEGLCKIISNQIPYVVTISLKYHKTDPVYRLLEILLKYNMNFHYSIVLVALFDYKYRQGDLKGCCEILNWSKQNKIILPSVQHDKFLKLLLKCDKIETVSKRKTPQYELKF